MSRITKGECSCMDMEWYGVDQQGNIAVFCSAGEGNLPEFICENVERADMLMELFDKMRCTSGCIVCFDMSEGAKQVAVEFAQKGLFYFDADDFTRKGVCTLHSCYTKASYPITPLKINDLSIELQELLKFNVIEIIDFSAVDIIHVKHAYEG